MIMIGNTVEADWLDRVKDFSDILAALQLP